MNTPSISFTRYLYETTEVAHSMLFALLDHKREEALFWAYELYFSGFEPELAEWIQCIYDTFYSKTEPHYREHVVLNLGRLSTLPDPEERDCLIGTIISNLAHRAYDIQEFVSRHMTAEFDENPVPKNNHKIYIRFRPRDLEKYKTKKMVARKMLEHVSEYPIRKSETLFIQKYANMGEPFDGTTDMEKSYLYDWLYYASKTPIWEARIREYNAVIDDSQKMVRFTSDDEYEMFHDDYGYEPDEQSEKIHILHGIDVHRKGIFDPLCPHEFIFAYSETLIVNIHQPKLSSSVRKVGEREPAEFVQKMY